jgi:hypothetical protein
MLNHPRESKPENVMTTQPRKMSEIMKELADLLFRNPIGVPSSEAAHLALMFANIAWNETVGLVNARESYRRVWEEIEADNPELWGEFKSNDVNGMIDEIVKYKNQHYPDDQRRILTCGIPDGSIRVEWLDPAAPGVDSKWEMRLYGLARSGQRETAIQFLQQTRRMSRGDAEKKVATVAAELDRR